MATNKSNTTKSQGEAGYAPVNGLEMYYEIHGAGEPLLLLHGQFASIGMFSRILPALAQSRRVVAVEQQAAVERGLTAAELSSIAAPALVMAAERDVIRPEHSRDLARLLRTELVILPDSVDSSYVSDNTATLRWNLRTFFQLPE